MPAPEFDRHAATYQEEIERAIGFSGMEHAFFTRAKAEILLEIADGVGGRRAVSALDVGCGVGSTDAYLAGEVGYLAGTDVSAEQLAIARRANPTVTYAESDGATLPFETASFDLAFTICVLHHVPATERPAFMRELHRVVRPGGALVVVEHNPVNPLTRLIVARCAFDQDAVLLGRREAEALLRGCDASHVRSRYILLFPSEARPVRRLERLLGPVPIGAQYVSWARR